MNQLPLDNDKKDPNYQECEPIKPFNPENAIASTSKENDTIAKDKEDKSKCKNKINFPSWITAFCTVAIAIITGFYTHYASEQVAQMKVVVKNANNQLRLEQRAWVAPFNISSEAIGNKTIFKVLFKNTGKTPALNVTAWINRTDRLDQITSIDPYSLEPGFILIQEGVGNTSTSDSPIEARDVEAIKHGLQIYVYGTIRYQDIFGEGHWTQFCYFVGPDLKAFGACKTHNSCDYYNQEGK